MALRTADEYRASLRDGRRVYFRGKPVNDVTTHPFTKVAVDHAALDYELANDPEHRDLAVFEEDGRHLFSRYYQIPLNRAAGDDRCSNGSRADRRAASARPRLLPVDAGAPHQSDRHHALNALQIVRLRSTIC